MRVDVEREFWDRVAHGKNIRHEFIVDKRLKDKDFIKLLKPLLKGYTLEIGCGIGRLSELYDCGIDISRGMLKKAPKGKEYKVCDGRSIPYPDETFSSVFCVLVFQHIPDIQSYIDEAYRVLKPGGKFIFQFIQGNSREGAMSFKHTPILTGWHRYRAFEGILPDWTWGEATK